LEVVKSTGVVLALPMQVQILQQASILRVARPEVLLVPDLGSWWI
jgi:hypothetical protein